MNLPLLFAEGQRDAADLTPYRENLTEDLCLGPVLDAMAAGDRTVRDSLSCQIFAPLTDPDAIRYRSEAMQDAFLNCSTVGSIYAAVSETLEAQGREELRFTAALHVTSLFRRARRRMEILLQALRQLSELGKNTAFRSRAFICLFASWQKTLSPEFFAGANDLMHQLNFPDGMQFQARTALNGHAADYRLLYHTAAEAKAAGFSLPDTWAQSDLIYREERALGRTAVELAQAVSGIAGYLEHLKRELAFYIGGIRLMKKLEARHLPFCFPVPAQNGWTGKSLLALHIALQAEHPVSNSFRVLKSALLTGADLGGKTTFLRSIAQSQLFFQAGLPVAGEAFSAPVTQGIYTHFPREEDPSMVSGKLAEELDRMNEIMEHIRPGAVLFSCESFCSTNDAEGSALARNIFGALRDAGVAVFAVTHLYLFARKMLDEEQEQWTFLIAQRLADGTRTYRILPGPPQTTAFSEDIYREVFQEDAKACRNARH